LIARDWTRFTYAFTVCKVTNHVIAIQKGKDSTAKQRKKWECRNGNRTDLEK